MLSLINDTTIHALATASQADAFAFIFVIALLVFLIWKEIVDTMQTREAQRIRRALHVVLAPCGLVFFFIAIVKVLTVLG